jgi:cysteine desulfurase
MSSARQVYLDYNSTTPCAPEVVSEMMPFFAHEYGNAASPHRAGRLASVAIARAREEVASAIGTESACIVFTSGATEANNLALFGMARGTSSRRKVVVSAIEHKSVLVPATMLVEEGCEVTVLPVDGNGVLALDEAERVIDDTTLVVVVQAANNETGVIQPVGVIASLAHAKGAFCHCDAAQAIGKMPVMVEQLDVDTASFSAHKVYGPKGVGALFVSSRPGRPALRPMLWGGGQEERLRAGTLNVPGIVGFGCACRLAGILLEEDVKRILRLRAMCEDELLRRLPGVWINARSVPRLPGTMSLTIPGIPADMLTANLPTVCIGDGAACNSGAPEPSHVLLAMNLSRSDAECTVRISLGRYTTESEVQAAVEEVTVVVRDLLTRIDKRDDLDRGEGRGRDH